MVMVCAVFKLAFPVFAIHFQDFAINFLALHAVSRVAFPSDTIYNAESVQTLEI